MELNKKITIDELVEKYPKIFQDYEGNPERVNWYCPDGWLPILDILCGSIQSYIDHTVRYTKDGPVRPAQVTCSQMKEKFGELRFYTDGNDSNVDGMIDMAEYMCDNTCEACGTHENLGYTQGWISVRCENCKGTETWKPKK